MLQVIYWLEVEKNISRLFFFDFGDTVYITAGLWCRAKVVLVCVQKNLVKKIEV